MHIAYVNANYIYNHTGGGHVHMGQFVSNAISLGHEIYAYSDTEYPEAKKIPTDHLKHISLMRRMDALYIRLENRFPIICKWSLPPRRWLYGFPLVVWEFNTIPADAIFRGESEKNIRDIERMLKHYGRGCDLAVCVAPATAEYVSSEICIKRTVVISNGSDPDMFKPGLIPVERMAVFKKHFNIVWIGSAKEKYHDFEMIKQAAKIIWEKEDCKFINIHIIGADLKYIMSDMPGNVFYWGAEEYKKLPRWLAAMDLGLYITKGGASTYGSPLKVFDYFSSGLAVVSTSHPAVNDLFEKINMTDQIVSPGDHKALAEILIKLGNDKERVRKMGTAGRQLIIDQYNWHRAVQDTINAMEATLIEKGMVQKS